MGRGSVTGDGIRLPEVARAALRVAPGRILARLSLGGCRLLCDLPALGMACHVLHRGPSGAALTIYFRQGKRDGSVARIAYRLADLLAVGLQKLAAIPFSRPPHDNDDVHLARDAGYVSHLPPASASFQSPCHGCDHHHHESWSDLRRSCTRPIFRPVGPAAR